MPKLLRVWHLAVCCLFLFCLSAPAAQSTTESLILLSREPLDARELAEIASVDDLRVVPVLESALELRSASMAGFEPAPIPSDLDRESVVCLEGIARLAPHRALEIARRVSDGSGVDLRWKARAILARSGDRALIHRAVTSYFSDPERWGRVLALAADFDPRLLDYRRPESAVAEAALRLRHARIEHRLSTAPDARAQRALLEWARRQTSPTSLAVAARVLSRIPRGASLDQAVDRQLARLGASDHVEVVLPALDGLARRSSEGFRELFQRKLERGTAVEQAMAAVGLERLGVLGALTGLTALPSPLTGAQEPFVSAASQALTALGGAEQAHKLLPILRGRGFRAVVPLLGALGPEDSFTVQELVQSLPADERVRALRFLAVRDHPALAGLPMGARTIDALHPYLARSSQSRVRDRIRRADKQRGAALASLLMSESASHVEKSSVAAAMVDVWPAAVVSGGASVALQLEQIWQDETDQDQGAWFSKSDVSPELVDALGLIPGGPARQRLEQLHSVAAIEQLGRRSDVILSLPAFDRFSRSEPPELRLAAEKILLRLGAGGASAMLQRRIALDQDLTPVLASIAQAPLPPRMVQDVLASAATTRQPHPIAMTALFLFHETYPRHFVSWLPVSSDAFGRRVVSAIALSRDVSRLPILVDLAASAESPAMRSAAFAALVETDLESYARRLHRLAGEGEELIRFQTAAALVPSGEAWTIRLLLAELDEQVEWQRRWARNAFDRLDPEKGQSLLRRMIADDTVTLFGLELFLDQDGFESNRSDRTLQRQLWGRLAEDVAAGNSHALELAARLTEPRALTAVLNALADR